MGGFALQQRQLRLLGTPQVVQNARWLLVGPAVGTLVHPGRCPVDSPVRTAVPDPGWCTLVRARSGGTTLALCSPAAILSAVLPLGTYPYCDTAVLCSGGSRIEFHHHVVINSKITYPRDTIFF